MNYIPGDVLMVKPKNSAHTVEQFFDLFSDRNNEIYPDLVITLTKHFADMQIPSALQKPVTLRKIVEEYWDLNVSLFSKDYIINLKRLLKSQIL